MPMVSYVSYTTATSVSSGYSEGFVRMYMFAIRIAWGFCVARSLLSGNAKTSRRGTSDRILSTHFLYMYDCYKFSLLIRILEGEEAYTRTQ